MLDRMKTAVEQLIPASIPSFPNPMISYPWRRQRALRVLTSPFRFAAGLFRRSSPTPQPPTRDFLVASDRLGQELERSELHDWDIGFGCSMSCGGVRNYRFSSATESLRRIRNPAITLSGVTQEFIGSPKPGNTDAK